VTTRLRRACVLAAFPFLLAGCATAQGGSAPAPNTGGAPDPGSAKAEAAYTGHLHLSGAASADVDWRDANMRVFAGTCQDIGAKGNGGKGIGVAGQYQMPPVATVTSGAVRIDVDIRIKEYHGPGTYDPSEFSGDVTVHTGGDSHGYDVGPISHPVVRTAADGSGELTFTHAQEIYHPDAPTLDGDLKWVCSD
jgi:hypothetical protein